MTVNLSLLLAAGVLFGTGGYMLMERSLTRVLLGFLLLSNGANLLLLQMGGPAGQAPISDEGVVPENTADPLVQALILTAIVITFAASAFVLALIYRSWRLAQVDLVTDDLEDRLVASQAAQASEHDEAIDAGDPATEFGQQTRPEDHEQR